MATMTKGRARLDADAGLEVEVSVDFYGGRFNGQSAVSAFFFRPFSSASADTYAVDSSGEACKFAYKHYSLHSSVFDR